MAPGLQISIPTTSTATPPDSKPYTLYHVVLQLPLRKHEIRKRYTDFVNLHRAFTTETPAAPPARQPPKSWFRRTINNPAQLETRRQGLEQYVRAILDADDARWRSSGAWRTFLNLPGGGQNGATLHANGTLSARSGSAGRGGNETAATAATSDPNRWVDVHRELKTQIQGARQRLKQREAATTAQAQHTLAAEAKAGLVRAAASIAQLDDGLKAIATASRGDDGGWGGSPKLGEGEIRRRRDLIAAAKKEVEGLEGVLKSMATKAASASSSANTTTAAAAAAATEKEGLWKGTNVAAKPGGRVLGGPLKETERTREHDNAGVLQLQKQIMQEQDEDVLTLGKTVARLKDMGIMINEELSIQNEMLNIVEEDTDRVQGKVDVARNRIKRIK